MGSYLVRVVPQRGFETRRRSGLVFSVAGTVIAEAEMTPEIRTDPGLVVTPVADTEAEALREALAGAGDADGDGFADGEGDDRPQCAYPKANGEQCRNRAREGSRFCGVHSDGGDEGGATVVTA